MTRPNTIPSAIHFIRHWPLPALLLGAGTLILAVHPIEWLVQTWLDPSYDSLGAWIFAAVVALFAWSVTSPKASVDHGGHESVAVVMLIGTSLLRLLSQVLAINILGAMALVADVYALGLLAGLKNRQRALSPGWLAILFAFSLPLTNLLQRTAGYLLQLISAQGAGGFLSLFFPETHLEGVRIFLAGKEVLVDLPCSGAQCTAMLLVLFAVLMALGKPSFQGGMLGLGFVSLLAFVANTARIVLMTLGIVFPEWFGGLDVLAQPWHDLIGMGTLLLFGFIPLLAWSRSGMAQQSFALPSGLCGIAGRLGAPSVPRRLQTALATLFLVGAVWIIRLPQTPVDISQSVQAAYLPASINHRVGRPVALTAKEQAYFTRYGGQAAKMQYGDQGVMVVQTTAPLRHLHSPADCMRGLGFQVTYLGVENQVLPSAVYRATSAEGKSWRVAVSFVSRDASGRRWATASVAEAIWSWFQNPGETWMAVQRISPENGSAGHDVAWERSVAIALDLPLQKGPAGKQIAQRLSNLSSVKPVKSEGVQ